MADSCSSSIDSLIPNTDKSVHVSDTKKSSTEEKINVTIFANGKRGKRKMTVEQYRDLTDKLLEIEQITCEEHLVHEKLNHINSQKQYLQNLLNILHVMDSNDRKTNSQYRQRRLQKLQSKSDLN